jgi:DNA-binding MarR family transcriptional regulator
LTVKDLGQYLYLDSGTLTPLLKKLENKGFITRKRSESDERNVIVRITDTGKQLQDEALMIPEKILSLTTMDQEELKSLYHILNKLLQHVE